MTMPFLDANVLVRHFTGDNAAQSPRATAYLRQIEEGAIRVRLEPTVIFETVFLLEKQYKIARDVVRDGVLALIDLPGIVLAGKNRFHVAFALHIEKNLPFADAYHVAVMQAEGLSEIVTFDREFDRIPGITRTEP